MTHIHFNIVKLMTHITIHIGFHALWSQMVDDPQYFMFSNVQLSTKRSTLGMLIGPKDPIPLWHFSLKETKAKDNLMEDQNDLPMRFDPELIPDLAVAGRMLVLGVRVLPCMGPLEDTSDLIQCPHSWPVCMGLSVRRRWRIQSGISSPTVVTSWSR